MPTPTPTGRESTPGPYAERLTVPLRWWVQATMMLASLWLAFVVAMPFWAATAIAGGLSAVLYALFAWFGSARLEVRDGELHAGPARIPVSLTGTPEALEADATRRALGVEADARAFLLTRPYLRRSVRVPILDPADPAPYWLLSSRRPERLAAALETAATSGRPTAG